MHEIYLKLFHQDLSADKTKKLNEILYKFPLKVLLKWTEELINKIQLYESQKEVSSSSFLSSILNSFSSLQSAESPSPQTEFQLLFKHCLLYTSDAADDTPCVDLGGRRIIKKKKNPM
eukprot:TRINITY_DN44938_c0_g1_i1.p1 TRINITY_DN44938_c0_g1~~TRINITY_DN44938_c0_g1_i1.p1  ORF type:complete len:118 (+),score=20.26 TRINITY_DN44938_c0_g1_i1:386-739(+)